MTQKAEKRAENKDRRPRAVAKYIRISPSKVRIVIDLLRGKSYPDAVAILQHTPKSASAPVLKLLNSCAANAEVNNGMSRDDLFVAEIYADNGPTLKRFMPRARGRASSILKRSSHITVVLDSVSNQ
jgi:large subunit ribosomal protein L22